MSFIDLAADVALLRDEAKVLRDAKDYPAAIATLQVAIDLIDTSGWERSLTAGTPLSESERKIAWHLADCLGMLGGNYRRSGRLDEAIKCFVRGRAFERDPRYRLSSSYNTVNAIMAPIEEGARDAASQGTALREAVELLKRQIFDPEMAESSRRSDQWAWADLGQCELLLGEVERARAAFQRFLELGGPTAFRSCRDVLQSVQNALREKNDATAESVGQGIAFLSAALNEGGNRRLF